MELHDGQKKVIKNTSQRKLIIVGARWGKTTLAIETAIEKCTATPEKLVQIYVARHDRIPLMVRSIMDRLNDLDIEYEQSHNQITFPNKSVILVNVPMKGDIIFDDAFDGRNVTIFLTPIGWMKHQASGFENTSPEVQRQLNALTSTFSESYRKTALDGSFSDIP